MQDVFGPLSTDSCVAESGSGPNMPANGISERFILVRVRLVSSLRLSETIADHHLGLLLAIDGYL